MIQAGYWAAAREWRQKMPHNLNPTPACKKIDEARF
jgi:hypothetical protein